MEAQRSVKPWTQEALHFRHSEATPVAVESPGQAQSSTLSFPSRNHPGDSRVERENDSK